MCRCILCGKVIRDRAFYLARHGSHAYGLARPTSDVDVKGVCIEPAAYHLGFLQKFEQEERMAAKGNPEDKVVYALKKFAKLAAELEFEKVKRLSPRAAAEVDAAQNAHPGYPMPSVPVRPAKRGRPKKAAPAAGE